MLVLSRATRAITGTGPRDSPQNAITHKGKIRIALENKLEAAARDGVLPDRALWRFFRPETGEQLVLSGHGQAAWSGQEHFLSWRQEHRSRLGLPPGRRRNIRAVDGPCSGSAGFCPISLPRRLGRGRNTDDRGNTPVFKLASPFNETMRELYAMRPLWETPIDLDNTRLVEFLGKEHRTQLDHAMEITLRGLGCVE
jgi:hypothetical protein